YRPQLLAVLGCVVLLLAIGFANIINLLSMRATGRRAEMALRRAIGASNGRLVAQVATEGGLLATAGGALGLLIATWAVGVGSLATPLGIPRLDEVHIDVVAGAATVALSGIATLLFSLLPLGVALKAAPEAILRGASRALGSSGSHTRLRSAFVIG